jgi:hypothetical protein
MVDNNKIERIKESISKLFNNNNSNNYIFIYTPPKVGSTTLVSSLRISLGKTYNIIHIHDEVMLSVLTGINNITVNEMINYLATLGENVFVIDVYRTPIERKISEFFEKISPYHFNNTEENINKYSIERVSNRFNKIFTHIENEDHYFDKYNIPNPIPFDYNNKYTIQEINKIKYIKLRLCDTTNWSNILSNIFNSHIVLVTDYQTENKVIGNLYKKFKNEYKLPSNYFEIIKECKYLKFYYSKEEREKYLNFWLCRLCEPVIPYTDDEYKFYVNLYLENQYINDIQIEHYIDNGCFCKYCSVRRRDILLKSKNGETRFEKIIHKDVIIEEKINKIKIINEILKKTSQNKKYNANQFSIKLK